MNEIAGYAQARFDDEDWLLCTSALKYLLADASSELTEEKVKKIKKLIRKIEILLEEPDEEGGYVAIDMENK